MGKRTLSSSDKRRKVTRGIGEERRRGIKLQQLSFFEYHDAIAIHLFTISTRERGEGRREKERKGEGEKESKR